jgi:hypothetical protein
LASILSLLGLMHAWKFANGDTALNIPLLDWLAGEPITGGWENLAPAWPFAAAYALITAYCFSRTGSVNRRMAINDLNSSGSIPSSAALAPL